MTGHQSAAESGAQIIKTLGIGHARTYRVSRCGKPVLCPTFLAASGSRAGGLSLFGKSYFVPMGCGVLACFRG
jgi:hypothetical protein